MDKKIAENLKNRLDSHDKLWYPVVTARLVKSNRSSSDSSEEMPATLFAEIRFLHSILLFIKRKAAYGLLRFPCAQRRRSGTASCAKKKQNAGHTDLTTCASRFLFAKRYGFRLKMGAFAEEELSLDTQRESTIIKYIGKTRKVVFL